VPALILHATADSWVALEHAELATRRIPHVRLIRFEGADHIFFIPRKEEVLALLSRFVEENAP
jgi:pimeloyl-ACP methyl ester carboxylesterase